jgi:hypothetical protein
MIATPVRGWTLNSGAELLAYGGSVGYGEKISRNVRAIIAARSDQLARTRLRRRYVYDALRRAVPYVGVETHGVVMLLQLPIGP